MTYQPELACTRCGLEFSPQGSKYSCPKCSGILEVKYDRVPSFENAWSKNNVRSFSGVWKFFDLLPLSSAESIVSLYEGNTPLIKSSGLGSEVYYKDETRNPTGSFKDRPNTVGISKAIELGAKTIAIASSGNAAGSLSAYAAKANLQCVVCVPEDTPDAKLNQIKAFGAKIVRVKGNYSSAFNLVKESCKRYGWHNLTSVCSANPFQVEGDKTAAYEIYEQLNFDVPDWVIIPLGAGPLLVGILKGFQELQSAGLAKKIPRLVGVQAEACSPIVKSFKNGEAEVSPWEGSGKSIAHSISDPLTGYEEDGTLTLRKIRESEGVAESVVDQEILQALRYMSQKEGIFAEPAAASSTAALLKLKNAGTISNHDTVVLMITGTGLKSPGVLDGWSEEPAIIDPDPERLLALTVP